MDMMIENVEHVKFKKKIASVSLNTQTNEK